MRNPNNVDRFQICGGHASNNIYVRGSDGDNWVDWELLSYGVPDFYKNYQNLGSLASALGAVKTGSGDANTIGDEWHMCSNNVSNVPTPYGLLHTKKYSDALFMQEYFSTVDKQSYTRTYYSDQWHDWTSLNSFGCSTPEALASLLGVSKGSLTVEASGTGTIAKPQGGILYVRNYSANAKAALFVINKDSVTPLTTDGIDVLVSADQNNITIRNTFQSLTTFGYIIIH